MALRKLRMKSRSGNRMPPSTALGFSGSTSRAILKKFYKFCPLNNMIPTEAATKNPTRRVSVSQSILFPISGHPAFIADQPRMQLANILDHPEKFVSPHLCWYGFEDTVSIVLF
jgi:hypothetical protein